MHDVALFPVLIAGAGPGDPELLTVKAVRALAQAQDVVYDRLIPSAILEHIPAEATRHFAGKSCRHQVMTQSEINDTLARLARAGRRVVRLKGGDPFIFGRGGEEAEHLARQGLAFEIIPGISSASGCSASCNIPLTHRTLAKGVRYITGHSKNSDLDLDWPALADPDTTLVVYMGLANLGIIARKLMQHGLPEDFPVAAIQDGTIASQRLVAGTLKDIDQKVRKAGLEPPTLIIVGRVVTLHDALKRSSPAFY